MSKSTSSKYKKAPRTTTVESSSTSLTLPKSSADSIMKRLSTKESSEMDKEHRRLGRLNLKQMNFFRMIQDIPDLDEHAQKCMESMLHHILSLERNPTHPGVVLEGDLDRVYLDPPRLQITTTLAGADLYCLEAFGVVAEDLVVVRQSTEDVVDFRVPCKIMHDEDNNTLTLTWYLKVKELEHLEDLKDAEDSSGFVRHINIRVATRPVTYAAYPNPNTFGVSIGVVSKPIRLDDVGDEQLERELRK